MKTRRPTRPQRPLTLPNGETIMVDDPDAVRYTDAQIRAISNAFERVFGTKLSPRRRTQGRDGRFTTRRRLFGRFTGR